MKYVPSKGEDFRLAVVVSKKVSKSAVKRNRIRRRVFEKFRVMHKELDRPLKYDIIVTVFDDSVVLMPDGELTQLCAKLASVLRTGP